MMQTSELIAHPAFAPDSVRNVTAGCDIIGPWLELEWQVSPYSAVVLPLQALTGRANDLWITTCFELFVKPREGSSYCEFNFAPSGQWAAYDFTDWRAGMADRPLSHDPAITVKEDRGVLMCKAALPLADLPDLPADLSLTCVIEEEGGAKSYWAAAHASPEKPNFHDASCFGFTLGPPHAL